MLTESEEVDFSQEIVSGENGELTLEPINPEMEEEEVGEVEQEVETGVEEEEIEADAEIETETETEVETETEIEEEETKDFESFDAMVNGEKMSIDSAEEAQKIIENLSRPKQTQPDVWEQAQKELGVTTKDLALISAVKGGDKDALLFLAKEAGLDISQLIYDEAPESFDKDFKPKVQNKGQQIMSDIEASGEMKTFSDAIDATDSNFIENLSNAQNLTAFRKQVASGKAAELMPLAKKMSALENITLFEAYAKVGHEQKATGKTEKVTKKVTKKTPPAKKATPAGKETTTEEEDPWLMSDEEFDKKYGGKKI